jgi:hypothetical protein
VETFRTEGVLYRSIEKTGVENFCFRGLGIALLSGKRESPQLPE